MSDPFYGKRKPSATLKRIQRTLSIQESRKHQEQREANSGQEKLVLKEQHKRTDSESIGTGAERSVLFSGGFGAQTTSRTWITKDDFVNELFRMM